MMYKFMTCVAATVIAATAFASSTEQAAVKIPSVKAGKCSITLLSADGIKPLAGAKLELQSATEADSVLTTVANDAGLCVVALEEGRYVLSVDEKVLTLLDAAKEGELAWCRIIVSEKPMLIGGQDPVVGGGFTFLGLQGPAAYAAAGGAGALGLGAGAVGGDFADVWDIDGVDDSSDDETPAPTSP